MAESIFKYKSATDRIKEYLDQRAVIDPLFAAKYNSGKKTVEGAFKYILSEAKKAAQGGNIGIADDDVFQAAVHYFDEDGIDYEKKTAPAAVVTTTPDATPPSLAAPPSLATPTPQPAAPQPKKRGRKKKSETPTPQPAAPQLATPQPAAPQPTASIPVGLAATEDEHEQFELDLLFEE